MTAPALTHAFAALLDDIRFDANGLVPAIAQQHDTGEVLMMAWMNAEAIAETLATGRVCYWSRSRSAPWRKGTRAGRCSTWSRCCCWWIKPAAPATRGGDPAFTGRCGTASW